MPVRLAVVEPRTTPLLEKVTMPANWTPPGAAAEATLVLSVMIWKANAGTALRRG